MKKDLLLPFIFVTATKKNREEQPLCPKPAKGTVLELKITMIASVVIEPCRSVKTTI